MQPDVLVVDDPAAARTLMDDEHRRYLRLFLGAVHSTAEVAAALGESVERTAYRVRTLHARGLLSIAGERRRAGRTIVLYEAAADIRAPIAALPLADIAHVFDLIDRGGRQAFLDSLARQASRAGVFDWSLRFYAADDGTQRLDLHSPSVPAGALEQAAAPAVVFNWVPVRLDHEQAKLLQRSMTELVERLPVSTAQPTHLAGVFLTPLG